MTTMFLRVPALARSISAANASPDDDRGSVTVEVAVALPALVFVLVIGLWGVTVAGDRVACVDAARAGARAAARGEDLAAVRAVVAKAAPSGADIEIGRNSDLTYVAITAKVHPPANVTMPDLVLHERAETLTEPDVGGP